MNRRFWVVGCTLTTIFFVVMVLWSFSVNNGVVSVGWPKPFLVSSCTDEGCTVFVRTEFWKDVAAVVSISFSLAWWYSERKGLGGRKG